MSRCEAIGGKIASVLSQEVKDAYIGMYDSEMNEPRHWIGLNDKGNIQIEIEFKKLHNSRCEL